MFIFCPKAFFLIFLFIASPILGAAQKAIDSARMAQMFQEALLQSSDADSVLNIIETQPEFKEKEQEFIDNYYYLAARFFYMRRAIVRAYEYVDKGILFAKQSRRIDNLAKFFNIEASLYSLEGNYTESITSFNKAAQLMDHLGDEYSAALVKNNIANIFLSLRDYASAAKYAESSYNYLKEVGDSLYLPSIVAVLAVAEVELDRIHAAEDHANESVSLSNKYGNVIGLIIGNYAMGDILLRKNRLDSAILAYEQSLRLATSYQQKHYALLNEIALAKAHYLNGTFEKSVNYGQSALIESEGQQNKNVQYSIKKYLAYALAEVGKTKEAVMLLKEVHEFYLIQSDEENKEIINEILIKYETEKKEKELTKKALVIAQNETQIQQQNIFIFLLISVSVLLLILYLLYRRSQKIRLLKLRIAAEKRIYSALSDGEEKERYRISTELHDGLASEIAALKMKTELIQQEQASDLRPIEHKLEALHEEIRKISHNLMPVDFEKIRLDQALHNYCKENTINGAQLHFSGSINPSLDKYKSRIVYRVCQELINNARKHGQSKNCFIQINSADQRITISIEDDGVGFTKEELNLGQGISSIQKRLASIAGSLDFESSKGSGSLFVIKLDIIE